MQIERLIQFIGKGQGPRIFGAVLSLMILNNYFKNRAINVPNYNCGFISLLSTLLVTSTALRCLLNSFSAQWAWAQLTGLYRHCPDVKIRAGTGRSPSYSALLTGTEVGAHCTYIFEGVGEGAVVFPLVFGWVELTQMLLLLGHLFSHSFDKEEESYWFWEIWGSFVCACWRFWVGGFFNSLFKIHEKL